MRKDELEKLILTGLTAEGQRERASKLTSLSFNITQKNARR